LLLGVFYPSIVDQTFYVFAGTMSGYNVCANSTEHIVSEINTAISNGYKTIIFDNLYEALYFEIIKKLHRIVSIVNNSNITYFYYCSAQNANDAYQIYCEKNNIPKLLTMLPVSVFEYTTNNYLQHFYRTTNHPVIEYKQGIKSKLFCCFNKTIRDHRTRIFYNIMKHELLRKTYSSFQYGKEVVSRLRHASKFDDMFKVFKRHYGIFPLTLNMTDDRQNPVDVREGDLVYHANSYFSLVTETLFYKNELDAGESIFLTEKTFRPIMHKHPFILVSTAHSLTYLKKLGYKSFSPYINEHYDTIEDDEERMNAVWAEVERLCAFTDAEWLEWQKGIVDIVNYNYDVLTNKTSYLL
jgi:hypothetical protein